MAFMYIKPCNMGNISDIGLPELIGAFLISGPLEIRELISSWGPLNSGPGLSINGL